MFWGVIKSVAGWIFVVVGTVALSLSGILIFWPICLVFERASGRLPHQVSQFWARTLSALLPFWEIRCEGREKIRKDKAYVVVSNHQSLLDIMVVLAQLPLHFKFIAKRELFWIPFFGWHLFASGYIPLKRGDAESGRCCLEKARHWLARGVSVLFFPEGTRSPDGQVREFKVGAFKLAEETGAEILPVVIKGTRDAIPKHSWVVKKRAVIHLKALDPISIPDPSQNLESIRDRVRTIMIRELNQIQ